MEIYSQLFSVQKERGILLVNFPRIPLNHDISVQCLPAKKYGYISTIMLTSQDQTKILERIYNHLLTSMLLSKWWR